MNTLSGIFYFPILLKQLEREGVHICWIGEVRHSPPQGALRSRDV